jgi:hypothetical protein
MTLADVSNVGSTNFGSTTYKQVHPRTDHEPAEGEQRCSYTVSLTSATDEGWPRHGGFTPGKETRYPLYRRQGGLQGRSGRVRKISPPPGFDPRTVQPIARSYTDYAISAHKRIHMVNLRKPGTTTRAQNILLITNE